MAKKTNAVASRTGDQIEDSVDVVKRAGAAKAQGLDGVPGLRETVNREIREAIKIEHREIPIGDLVESKTNPRRQWSDLGELAESIRRQGVLQPLLVRVKPDRAKGTGRGPFFELVFGHRRFRAAKLAGLEHLPCMVREMTDREVLEAQLIENVQRADIHPLEEALGYQALHTTHKMSVEDIAAKVGKSVAAIYGRLKLCDLTEKSRALFLEDKLPASVALLVARIPDRKLQDEAAAKCADGEWGGEGPMSYREASEFIERGYMLDLREIPWKRDDKTLLPKAGSCVDCPKRTGKSPDLFGDVKGKDLCTDPTCFKAKMEAHWERAKTAHAAAGGKVLEGKKAKQAMPYGSPAQGLVDLGSVEYVGGKRTPWKTMVDKKELDVTLVRDEYGRVHELAKRSEALAAVKKKKPALARAMTGRGHRGNGADPKQKRWREEQAREKRIDELALEVVIGRLKKLDVDKMPDKLLRGMALAELGMTAHRPAIAEGRGFEAPEPKLGEKKKMDARWKREKVLAEKLDAFVLEAAKPGEILSILVESVIRLHGVGRPHIGNHTGDGFELILSTLKVDLKAVRAEAAATVKMEVKLADARAKVAKAEKRAAKKKPAIGSAAKGSSVKKGKVKS